ncbi:MAG TPA: hypothetical protein VF797_21545, partial [Noviherbaspirillum sp.]
MLTSFFCTVVLLPVGRMAGMTFQGRPGVGTMRNYMTATQGDNGRASGWMHSCLQQASPAWIAQEHRNAKGKTETAFMPGTDSQAGKAKCPVDPFPESGRGRNALRAYGNDKRQGHALPTAHRTHAAFNLRGLIDVLGPHCQNKHLESQSMNNVFK